MLRCLSTCSGVTDGGGGGKCPPGSSDGGPFLEVGFLDSVFFTTQTIFKTLNLLFTQICFFLLLQLCLPELCASFFLKGTCIIKIVNLVKNHLHSWYPMIQWKWVKIVFLLFFFFFLKKERMTRVPVKGNCVDSGPSLVKETLSWLLSRNLKDRLSYVKLHYEFQLSKFYF